MKKKKKNFITNEKYLMKMKRQSTKYFEEKLSEYAKYREETKLKIEEMKRKTEEEEEKAANAEEWKII